MGAAAVPCHYYQLKESHQHSRHDRLHLLNPGAKLEFHAINMHHVVKQHKTLWHVFYMFNMKQ